MLQIHILNSNEHVFERTAQVFVAQNRCKRSLCCTSSFALTRLTLFLADSRHGIMSPFQPTGPRCGGEHPFLQFFNRHSDEWRSRITLNTLYPTNAHKQSTTASRGQSFGLAFPSHYLPLLHLVPLPKTRAYIFLLQHSDPIFEND